MGGYRRFREIWGCCAQVVMCGSGEVGVVMCRWLWVVQGKLGLLCTGGYVWFREIWGCYAQVVMCGSGEVGVVMSRLGVNGLMCGSSKQ